MAAIRELISYGCHRRNYFIRLSLASLFSAADICCDCHYCGPWTDALTSKLNGFQQSMWFLMKNVNLKICLPMLIVVNEKYTYMINSLEVCISLTQLPDNLSVPWWVIYVSLYETQTSFSKFFKDLADERRHSLCKVFYHKLKPCPAMDSIIRMFYRAANNVHFPALHLVGPTVMLTSVPPTWRRRKGNCDALVNVFTSCCRLGEFWQLQPYSVEIMKHISNYRRESLLERKTTHMCTDTYMC